MASSSDSQQSGAPASSSDVPLEQMFPPRIVVLDSFRHGGIFYVCRNRHHLEVTDPSHIILLHDDTPMSVDDRRSYRHINMYNLSFWGIHVFFRRDVFFLTKEFIKYRFTVMDSSVADPRYPEALDPWNALASTRPSHVMLDPRCMQVVLQEVYGGDSRLHHLRRCGQCHTSDCVHRDASDWGLPEFFRMFGMLHASNEPTLQRITVFIPDSSHDILDNFEYDDLEREPFVSEMSPRGTITSLANTQSQASQLDQIIDLWVLLLDREPTLGFHSDHLPAIEFARRPRR